MHAGIQIQMTLSGLHVERPVIWGKPGAPAFTEQPVRMLNLVRQNRLQNMPLFQARMMDDDAGSVASTVDQEDLRHTASVVSVSSDDSTASAMGGPIPVPAEEGNIPVHVSLRSYPEMPLPNALPTGSVRPSLRRFGHIGHDDEPTGTSNMHQNN